MMNSAPDLKRNKDTGAPGNGGRFAADARDESAASLVAPEAHWLAEILNTYDGIDVDAQWVAGWLPDEPRLLSLIEELGAGDTMVREELFSALTTRFLGRRPMSISLNGWAIQHAQLVAAIAESTGRAS